MRCQSCTLKEPMSSLMTALFLPFRESFHLKSCVVDFPLLFECYSSGPKQNVMSGSSPGMDSRPPLHLNITREWLD